MSALVVALMLALQQGQITTFEEIPAPERAALVAEFSGSFSAEQQAVLATLYFDVTGHEAEIAAFNAGSPRFQVAPLLLANGTPVIPVSIITWAQPGEGFSPLYDLLLTLPVLIVSPEDWPVSEEGYGG